jgi:NAD(P)-dependent dehydrogenase (short-subunit alcohol dehydrogenase family)
MNVDGAVTAHNFMRRIFITGSSDGLGFLAGQLLLEQEHSVVLHARNDTRARELKTKLPDCEGGGHWGWCNAC